MRAWTTPRRPSRSTWRASPRRRAAGPARHSLNHQESGCEGAPTGSSPRTSGRRQDPHPRVVTHATNIIEHPELAAKRITRYTSRLGAENVIAGTDCGFGGRIHPELGWAKLAALAEGAALASARIGKA
jgi:hypothetical protein